ncbi:MAG: hypothetical protein ABI282_01585 [Candidatus Baltobacteraceae bacterium]
MFAAMVIFAAGAQPALSRTQPAYRYMIGAGFVSAIAKDPAASAALDGTHPFINIQTIKSAPGQAAAFPARPPDVPASWQPVYVYRWASEVQMEADMPRVPSWITVCMYDNEDAHQTPMTPDAEIADPASYYPKAAQVCHKAGKLFIPSSGIRQFRHQNQSQNDAVYGSATQWDGYSMQTQQGESDLSRFRTNVDSFQRHVLAVNPNAKIFIVGVGDFAGGQLQSPAAIEAAIKSLPPGMAFWMNFGPHAGRGCKDCPIPARPDLLVQVIKDLATKS